MSLLNPNQENVQENKKTKEERMADLLRSVKLLQSEMEPFREQLKDLKRNYVENSWLTKEDISMLLRAWRLVREDVDIDELVKTVKQIQ